LEQPVRFYSLVYSASRPTWALPLLVAVYALLLQFLKKSLLETKATGFGNYKLPTRPAEKYASIWGLVS
jgi:hypothetical protein